MKRFLLDRLGIPGIAGMGLTFFCLLFYFGNVEPAAQTLTLLNTKETQLLKSASAQFDRLKATKTSDITAPLPQLSDTPELLTSLNSIADKYDVKLGHVSYRLLEKDGQHKIEVNLPLQGSYPALRSYLSDALAIAPTISLDTVNMQRPSSSELLVEARILLSYYLSSP